LNPFFYNPGRTGPNDDDALIDAGFILFLGLPNLNTIRVSRSSGLTIVNFASCGFLEKKVIGQKKGFFGKMHNVYGDYVKEFTYID
jgi:hypothetical protein